ncbi:MAG: VWA domain-containing protein, partial [Pyrinomonadaceae bacterium]
MARTLFAILLCFCVLSRATPAQDTSPPLVVQDDEVVRVSTDLVQTDVMVFDKQGHFVDGLQADQFELRVDGKPQGISFFERVLAGSVDEDAQLAAARGGNSRSASDKARGPVLPLDRGRTVFFFEDDLHLSAASVKRTRDTLLRFIDDEMGQNDEAAIASASGQIGFLQQLTSDKAVLRRAVARINYRPYVVRDGERPPMSEYQAIAVEQRNRDVVDFFVEQLLRDTPGLRRDMAENMVASRANQILQQAESISTNTLATLESLMRTSGQMPGRKIVFFVSDGFFINSRSSSVRDKLRRITDASARAGVVIYSMDARGLTTGMADAGMVVAFVP